MPSARLRFWALVVIALATVLGAASAARAEGATPLRESTAEENPTLSAVRNHRSGGSAREVKW